jgi:hypothetical protein
VLENDPAAAPRKILMQKLARGMVPDVVLGVNRCCAALAPWLTSNSYVRKV